MKIINPDIEFEEYIDIEKFRLARNVSAIMFLGFILLNIFFIDEKIEGFIYYLLATVITGSSLVYLLFFKNYNLIYWTYCVSGTILIIGDTTLSGYGAHYSSLSWCFFIIMVAFFGVSNVVGRVLALIFILNFLYFSFFVLTQNFDYLIDFTVHHKIGTALEFSLAIFLSSYVTHHFVKLNRNYSEELEDYKRIFSLSNDLVSIASVDGFFKTVNAKMCETLGYTEEELLSTPFINFVHPDDIGPTAKEIEKLKKGLKTIDFKNRYFTKNGELVYLNWSCIPDPKTGLFYSIARDESKLVASEKKQKQMFIEGIEKERERLSYELHDGLGQTLSAINMYFNAIQAELKRIVNTALQTKFETTNSLMARSIKEVREISQALNPRSLNEFGLETTIREIVNNQNNLHNEINISLTSNINEKRFDAFYELNIFRIFQELLNNALKHAQATEIKISLNEYGKILILIIEDNGVGIDNCNKSSKSLGLKSLNHRAKVINAELTNNSNDSGTTFTLTVNLTNP